MKFSWLKRYMPRSLYGRAALILLVPIVTIQLIVSAAFIQRYFADVTRQMTGNLTISLSAILDAVNAVDDMDAAKREIDLLARALDVTVTVPAAQDIAPVRAFYDLSGLAVARVLRRNLEGVGDIDLGATQKRVVFEVQTRHGLATMSFARSRVSAANPHQLLVIMVLAGVLLTLISYLFLRNQLRPIKRLADAAAAFGKGRVEVYHPSGAVEVRAAGSAFLDMRNRIERQMEQRTLMLSGVSHDLRTPLTRLKLGLSMIDDEDVANLIGDVEDMEALIDAFLDFARSDAVEAAASTNPQDLARAVVEKSQRMGKAVVLIGGDEEAEVKIRRIAVQRALDNLVGNAVHYGNTAQVSVALTERAVRFTVEDDGPGIPADKRETALQPFARLDPGRNQNKGSGVGLGLSIAFDVARAHGGTLRLSESAALGGLKAELILAR